MKALKIVGIVFIAYVALVAAFETWLWYSQPSGPNSLVITTTDEDGSTSERVLSRLELDGQLYVAANHWPRAWYRDALENPNVEISSPGGEKKPYTVVPATEEEAERLHSEHGRGLVGSILMGFAPRRFIRLDPR